MARHPFGGTTNDYVITVLDGGTVFPGAKLAVLAPAVVVTFYNAATGGTQITDLALNANGTSPVASRTTDANGALAGTFYGPDGTTLLWADANGGAGPRSAILARDCGNVAVQAGSDAASALASAITALTTATQAAADATAALAAAARCLEKVQYSATNGWPGRPQDADPGEMLLWVGPSNPPIGGTGMQNADLFWRTVI